MIYIIYNMKWLRIFIFLVVIAISLVVLTKGARLGDFSESKNQGSNI